MEFLNQLIYYPFLNIIAFFTWLIPGHNAAWGIIGLTLVVRTLLLLPSKRAAQSQRKVSQLQPLLDELKVEYGDDKQGFAVAQMELYKKNGINPLASCLPMLIQLPILFVLYHAVLNGLTNQEHLYSWLPHAAMVDTTIFAIDLLHPDPTFILPLLAAALQYIQARMVLPPPTKSLPGAEPDPTQMIQKQMVYILPGIIFITGLRFPAGAAIYWVVSTGYTIAQQYFVNKEKLKLTGISAAEVTAELQHPERAITSPKEVVKLKQESEVVDTSTKKGVQVTVRRKTK